MNTLEHKIQWTSDNRMITLWAVADTHLGHSAVDEALMQRQIDRIAADDNAYWVHLGDMIDAITWAGDPRYRPSSSPKWLYGVDDVVLAQINKFVSMFEPIASQCLGLLRGNHEEKVTQHSGYNAYRIIANKMAAAKAAQTGRDVAWLDLALGDSGFVTLRFEGVYANSTGSRWPMTLYMEHGAGGGNTFSGYGNKLLKMLYRYDCDMALMGHLHDYHVVPHTTIAPARNKRGYRNYKRMAFLVPSFMGKYNHNGSHIGTYAEAKMYRAPSMLGAIPIRIDPSRKLISATIDSGMEATSFS